MKTHFITTLLLAIAIYLPAQTPKVSGWLSELEGQQADFTNGIVSDSQGHIYIGGGYSDTLTWGRNIITSQGNRDFFFARLNKKGNAKWLKTAGGSGVDKITAMCIDSYDKVYVAILTEDSILLNGDKLGYDGQRILIASISSRGKVRPIASLAYTTKASAFAMQCTKDHLYIGGNFKDSISYQEQVLVSRGYTDIFVASLNLENEELTLQQIGGVGHDQLSAIGLKDQQPMLALSTDFPFQLGEQMLSLRDKKKNALVLQLDSELQLKSYTNYASDSYVNIVGLATDSAGQVYTGLTYRHSLYSDTLLALSSGLSDFYINCTSSEEGHMIWSRNFGGKYDDQLKSLQLNDKQLLISTRFADSLTLGERCYTTQDDKSHVILATLSTEGALIWSDQIAGQTGKNSKKAITDNEGNLYLTGSHYPQRKDSLGANEENIYIAKYCNCPHYHGIINGQDYIYPNEIITLKVPYGYDEILWNDSIASRSIEISSPGRYTVSMKDKNACLVNDTLEVELAAPLYFDLGNDTTLYIDQSLVLTGPTQAVKYQWQDGSNKQNYTASSFTGQAESETYQLCATDAWGTQYHDKLTINYIEREHIGADDSKSIIKIYPNPIDNTINWQVISEEWTDFDVIISNNLGLIMYQGGIKNYSVNTINTISASHYSKGSYTLKIVANDGRSAQTVVIKE